MSGDIFDRMAETGGGMSPRGHTPSGILYGSLTKKGGRRIWIAESEARAAHGSILDRTIGAVYLAAYLSRKDVFFVAPGPRKRFNLSSNQLRKGLDRLEARGLIETAQEKRKGRYRRVRLR